MILHRVDLMLQYFFSVNLHEQSLTLTKYQPYWELCYGDVVKISIDINPRIFSLETMGIGQLVLQIDSYSDYWFHIMEGIWYMLYGKSGFFFLPVCLLPAQFGFYPLESSTAGVLSKLHEFHLFYANFQSNLIPTAFHFDCIHNVFFKKLHAF